MADLLSSVVLLMGLDHLLLVEDWNLFIFCGYFGCIVEDCRDGLVAVVGELFDSCSCSGRVVDCLDWSFVSPGGERNGFLVGVSDSE